MSAAQLADRSFQFGCEQTLDHGLARQDLGTYQEDGGKAWQIGQPDVGRQRGPLPA